MPFPPEKTTQAASLSDEDLRALARRHGSILRRSRARLERELARREQQEMIYSVARQMAAAMLAAETQTHEQATAGNAASQVEKPKSLSEKHSKKTDGKRSSNADFFSKTSENHASGNANIPVVTTHHFQPSSSASPLHRFFRKIGIGGLSVSVLFHISLILIALFWVVSRYVEPPEPEVETFFATGSGGGNDGNNPSFSDRQAKRRASKMGAEMRENKIISKVEKSPLVLPEVKKMPTLNHSGALSSALVSGKFGDRASSGSGGGAGGGVGLGMGTGIGNARNFVSKFQTTQKILGTNVTAEKLAVYLDCSPSMIEVSDIVRREILTKFPTADVFQFWGCELNPQEGTPTTFRTVAKQKRWDAEKRSLLKKFEREKKLKKNTLRKALKSRSTSKKKKNDMLGNGDYYEQDNTWREVLSSYGKALLGEWERMGDGRLDLGSWLDMTLTEGGYDALFVFADFQDYLDGDSSSDSEKKTLERWLAHAKKNNQRLYFFTTEFVPAKIFCELAKQTGGDIAIPKETAKKSEMARYAEQEIKKLHNDAKRADATENKPQTRVPATEPTTIPEIDDDVPAENFDENPADFSKDSANETDKAFEPIFSTEPESSEANSGGAETLDLDGENLW